MTIHYTAMFEGSQLLFHGEVSFKEASEDDVSGNEDRIVKACKRKLVTDCERWGVETKELKSFECYYFANSKENRIMKWEKE